MSSQYAPANVISPAVPPPNTLSSGPIAPSTPPAPSRSAPSRPLSSSSISSRRTSQGIASSSSSGSHPTTGSPSPSISVPTTQTRTSPPAIGSLLGWQPSNATLYRSRTLPNLSTAQIPPNGPSSQPIISPPKRKLPVIFIEWQWEVFTWTVGTCAIMSMLALLLHFDGAPLPHWHSRVQIQALVAILSQLAQSALMVSVCTTIGQAKWSKLRQKRRTIEVERFDEAMRGPEGSFKMLALALANPRAYTLNHAHTLLALVAALITLLMLSFGTFTQQSVAINVRRVENSTSLISPSRTISRALSYRTADARLSDVPIVLPEGPFPTPHAQPQPSTFSGTIFTDVVLSAALLSGIAANHSLSDLTGQCSTSSCQWNSYTTLAVCSSVEDISSQLTTEVPDKELSVTLSYGSDLNIFLPNPALYGLESNPGSAGTKDFWMATLPGGPGGANVIAEVYLIYFPPCAATDNKFGLPERFNLQSLRRNISNWKAFKGSFSMCVQSLTSSSLNGATNTSFLHRSDNGPWNFTSSTSRVLAPYPNPASSVPPSGRVPYSVDTDSLQSLSFAMRLVLNGSALLSGGDEVVWANTEQIIFARDLYGADPQVCTPSNNTGIEGFRTRLQNIAVSLTNAFRSNPFGNEQVEGSTFSDEQDIDVRIAWLAMPIGIWFLVTLLLLSTMWQTVAMGLPSWKTSTLPWLECSSPSNNISSRTDIKKSARATYTQLRPGSSVWYLERTT